jgi:hypothetical protein
MKGKILSAVFLLLAIVLNAQQLQLLDRFNDNKVVNDSVIRVYSSDFNIFDITQYFTMKNNTDSTLKVNLRKITNFMNDSTSDYFCFGVKCWPYEDATDIPALIPPGAEDYTFASHVTHVRRFDWPQPVLPPGVSSVTYTIFDNTTFPEPVEASVTVVYELSGVGIGDEETGRKGEREKYVTVYPNPAAEQITIETGKIDPGNYTLLIYNSLGMMVQKSSVNHKDGISSIPVGRFPSGFYIGKLVSETGEIISFKFRVTH